MANLENNYDKEKDKKASSENKISIEGAKELVKDAVQHPVETAKEFTEQAAKDVVSISWWARLLQILFWIGLFLIVTIAVVINLGVTKQWAANQALALLNQDFKAQMTTESVDVDYFGDITIKGLKIKDEKGLDFIKIREFRANSNWIELVNGLVRKKNNHLSFDALQLRDADIKVITYKGDSISNFIKYIGNFDSGKPRDPQKPPFQLDSRVEIINSKVSIINMNSEGDKGKWLYANDFNLLAPSVKVNGADVFARINNLTFKTKRWGKVHFVDTFSADLALTKRFLSLKDLTLNTDHTLLQGDLKFNLNNGSWADFTDKVRWEMNLQQGSQISGYDISYFVTHWDNYKPVNLSGKMNGTLNNFSLNNFVLGNKETNIATNSIRLRNLLNGKFVIESNELSTDFTYISLKEMLPSFIATKMKNFADDFGRLKYNGAIRVMPEQIFVSKGNLVAGIGQVKITDFYLEDYSTQTPKYRGSFNVKDLNTTVITKSPQVGLISGDFNLQGQSFDVNEMVIKTKANIASIDIMDKTIHQIHLDGLLDKRTYKGLIQIDDAQAVANVDGFIDFRTSRLAADINADIKKLNIGYFTGQPNAQSVSGIIQGKVAMSNINDLDLDAHLKGIRFTSNQNTYTIPNADVKAYIANGNRIIEVNAPGAANGRIAGKYQLGDLGGMVQNGLDKILVGLPPRKLYKGQSFNVEMDIQQGLVNYFVPNLNIPQGIRVSGSYDGDGNHLVLNADAPYLVYRLSKKEAQTVNKTLAELQGTNTEEDKQVAETLDAEDLVLKINTANQEEQIFVKLERAKYGEHIFRGVALTGRNNDNKALHLSAKFFHGTPEEELNGNMKDYAIHLNQSTNAAGDYVVQFEPTEMTFNNITWKIDTSEELNHSIVYKKKTGNILVHNFRVYSDDSSILIKDGIFQSGTDFKAEGEIHNFQLSKLMEMQSDGNTMNIKGIANGTFDITMNKSNLEPLITLDVNEISMDGRDMGDIDINVKNSDKPNIFDVEANVASAGIIGDNKLSVTGTIDNNPKTPTLDIQADMKDFDLAFSQQFVKGVFGNMRGKANGILSISGPINDVDYSGDIALSGFGLKLNFTGVDYSFDDTVIPLSKGLAVLNDIKVRDGRANSSGTISGAIQFETLASMAVNLIMRADNLTVLNTQQKDFDLFWGRVYGQGDLYVSGPVSALNISTDINDPFKALNNSMFTFNAGSTSGVDEFKMLRFLKKDETGAIVSGENKKSGANMNLDFNVAVDKGTTVNVMLPADVGNISVRGVANPLRFRMERNGNISMNGAYLVDNGTFVSKAILDRTFQIDRGSKIQWDGDAMTPALDIKADYMRTVSNAGSYLGTTLPPVSVLLTVDIDGTLNNPSINLGVNAPDLTSQLRETLANKMMNEDEKVIQFGSILVMNAFNTQNSGFDVDLGSTLESSGYNMLFKQLGSVFNTISNEVQIDLNYLKGDQASNTGDRANASVSFTLSPRVNIKTGMGVPLSRGSELTETNYLSGEGIVEYDWSKNNDKTRLLRVYSKPSNIGLVGGASNSANQNYGVGVVYSKSFNTIFRRKKRNKKDSLKISVDSMERK